MGVHFTTMNSPPQSSSALPATPPEATGNSFGSFYQATLFPLRRYLALLLRNNRHDAQDIAQEAYVRTFRALRSTSVAQPKAFLFRTAHNLAVNYRDRRVDRLQPTEDTHLEVIAPLVPDAREAIMCAQEMELFEQAILGLPLPFREVMLLRYGTDLTQPQIAARLGVSLSTVENRLMRGMVLLRAALRRDPS